VNARRSQLTGLSVASPNYSPSGSNHSFAFQPGHASGILSQALRLEALSSSEIRGRTSAARTFGIGWVKLTCKSIYHGGFREQTARRRFPEGMS
jgi:hypothetical protein